MLNYVAKQTIYLNRNSAEFSVRCVYYDVLVTHFVCIEKDDLLTPVWTQGCFDPNWYVDLEDKKISHLCWFSDSLR